MLIYQRFSLRTPYVIHLEESEFLYGVEVEVQIPDGEDFPSVRNWRKTPDGSLRGNAIEYNLTRPMTLSNAIEQVERLYINLGGDVIENDQCGVHIHVDFRDISERKTLEFGILYYFFENLIARFSGPSREGNMFCLRLVDADAPLDYLISCFENNSLRPVVDAGMKYSAMNWATLGNHGSLECRLLKTPSSPEKIIILLKVMNKLKEFALENNIFSVLRRVSNERLFATQLLGDDLYYALTGGAPDVEEMLFDGLKNIQCLLSLQFEEEESVDTRSINTRLQNNYNSLVSIEALIDGTYNPRGDL